MKDFKTVVNIPEWAEMFNKGELTGAAAAYNLVPVLYRAVQLRCDSLSSVPVVVKKRGTDTESEFPFDIDLVEYIWKTEAALILSGGAYWLKLQNKAGSRVAGVKFLNPFSVNVSYAGEALFSQNATDGTGAARDFGPWGESRVVYFREYNPTDDIKPGKGDAEVALADAGMLRYLTRFASVFFERGAMPLTILEVPPGTQQSEIDKTEHFFKRIATGVKNAFSVFAVRSGGLKVSTITPPLNTLAIPELQESARRQIAVALKIPQTMLEDAANYATAKEHRLSFWQDTIRPRGRKMESVINRQLLWPLGLEMQFAFDELDIFQEDESQRAGSLGQLTGAGVPLLVAMELLGYDLTDEQIAVMQPAPVEVQEPADEIPEDVKRWQRKALNAFERGKSPAVEFITDEIDAATKARILARLQGATSKAEIMAAFETLPEPGNGLMVELKRANDLLEAINGNN